MYIIHLTIINKKYNPLEQYKFCDVKKYIFLCNFKFNDKYQIKKKYEIEE